MLVKGSPAGDWMSKPLALGMKDWKRFGSSTLQTETRLRKEGRLPGQQPLQQIGGRAAFPRCSVSTCLGFRRGGPVPWVWPSLWPSELTGILSIKRLVTN